MIIRRLDVFFRTQLALDTPNFFNSVTNVAFAPLQHLVGQNKYQSLQGKVTLVKSDPSTSLTVVKIIIYIGAFFALVLTPIGIAARYCSLRSPNVEEAYSIAFLSQMSKADLNDLLKHLPPKIQAKFLSLDSHQDYSVAYLLQNESEYQKLKQFLTLTLIQAYDRANLSTDPKVPSSSPRSPSSSSLPLSAGGEHESVVDLHRQQPQLAVAKAEEILDSTTVAAVPKTSLSAAHPSFQQLKNLEELLLVVTILQFGATNAARMFNFDKDVQAIGIEINSTIGMINRLFKTLLKESDPGTWLEKGTQTPLYLNHRPFATSYFFTKHLGNATCLTPYLDQALINEWKVNYEKCVLLLKEKKLDTYNETEFLFSEKVRLKMETLQKLSELMSPDTLEAKELKELMEDFADNPQKAIREIQLQYPELAELIRNQVEPASVKPGGISKGLGEIMLGDIKLLLPFFKNLDQELRSHPNDRAKIETWLKTEASKSDYPTPFFDGRHFIHRLTVVDIPKEELLPAINDFTSLFENCCHQLVTLGLEHYVAEGPPLKELVSCAAIALKEQDSKQKILSDALSIILPLVTELRKLDGTLKANRQVIVSWLEKIKEEKKDYFNPFEEAYNINEYHKAFEGILDGEMVQQLKVFYPFCRDQLLALGLEKYLYEPIPPKKAPWNSERVIEEILFFETMLTQKTLQQWLQKNSPKSDYPLLWGQKRMSQIDNCKNIERDLRRDWKKKFGKCVKKLKTAALLSYVDLKKIPEDASPQLRAFLST